MFVRNARLAQRTLMVTFMKVKGAGNGLTY
jgi:hypothetical protein